MKKPKKLTHRKQIAQRHRAQKKEKQEHQRKLIRKLYHICTAVNTGNWTGVKESPLFAVNSRRVRRYLSKSIDPMSLVNASLGL
jgi:hypothetical protein